MTPGAAFVPLLVDQATTLFKRGQYVDAAALWSAIAADKPGDPRLLWNVARSYEMAAGAGMDCGSKGPCPVQAYRAFDQYVAAETDPKLRAGGVAKRAAFAPTETPNGQPVLAASMVPTGGTPWVVLGVIGVAVGVWFLSRGR